MHVPWVHAESPEWYGAQFIGSILRRVLDNPVAGFNVMQQEIAVGMNDFASQSIRYSERSAVNHGSRRSRDDGADMAGSAADLFEQGLTCLGRRSCRENRVAWRNPRPADELSEVVDVC